MAFSERPSPIPTTSLARSASGIRATRRRRPQALGPYRHTVALDGVVDGRALPLVVILHGAQGVLENHYETALALADVGFVVAAVNHAQDISFTKRPRHVGRVLDHLLTAWSGRDRIDPKRIGVDGFSVGGFTTLAVIGGVPDLTRISSFCAERPDRLCGILKGRNFDTPLPASAWFHDARIRAAVVAAPTLGFTFPPEGFAAVRIPGSALALENDEITPHPWHAEAIYKALPATPEYIVIPTAGHFVFVSCSEQLAKRAPAICQDAPGFDRQEFQRTFNAAVVAFFQRHPPAD